VKVEGRGESLSANTGVVALRELDERLGFTASLAAQLDDPRDLRLITHPLVELLRSRLYLMALGHRDQDDADHFRNDPACRVAVSTRRGLGPLTTPQIALDPDGLASQPTQSRLVTALSSDANLETLSRSLLDLASRDVESRRGKRYRRVTIDIDSVPIEVHGQQPGSAYNGHYGIRCYHPLVTMLAETGAWLSAQLRPGNQHTAAGATEHLLAVINRVEQEIGDIAAVRGDAGFPEDGLLSALEHRRIGYAFRIKANDTLNRIADPYIVRPSGRPPNEPRVWCHELSYRAAKWSRPRRVVLVVLERPGELFLDWFFLVTSWTARQISGSDLLDYYRQRGTMEGHLGELKSALAPALSCTTRTKARPTVLRDAERANAATFLLYALAYNLLNSVRHVLNAADREGASGRHITTVRDSLLRIAGRFVSSGRRVTLVINRSALIVWGNFWKRLEKLHPVSAHLVNSS
jgi:hypothetical protein